MRKSTHDIFHQSEYDVAVNKSVSPGTPLLTVSAVDADAEGKNSRLSYHLEDKFSGHFSLDRYTGTLRTHRDLNCDEEEQGACPSCLGTQKSSCSILVRFPFEFSEIEVVPMLRLSIQIYAKDGGQPQQSAYTVVKVRVLEANDHDPEISFRYLPDQVITSKIDGGVECEWWKP